MIIKPRIRGFLCTSAHPEGCRADVAEQIAHVRGQGPIADGPKRVLIVGASGGYGLASRITAAFGCNASTVGVFFERPASGNRTASPGWYKSAAFAEAASEAGLYARSVNGDAFSAELKEQVADIIAADLGQVDLVVYSLAAPQRQLADGTIARSTLKPIGEPFAGSTIDLNTSEIKEIELEPATPEEVADTVTVMGGEDWQDWIRLLADRGLLAEGCTTVNYTYLGSEVTWPIYFDGTIGQAKKDLERATAELRETMARVGGTAHLAVMKGLLTQASSAIPGMSLYLSLLFKVMKEEGTDEGCIEQVRRLFATRLFSTTGDGVDEEGRIRMDEFELAEATQARVKSRWDQVTEANLDELTDFAGYKDAFLKMHGFNFDSVDYEQEVDADRPMELG